MSYNEILLAIIGGGLLVAMLYMFVRVILSPSSRPSETKTPPETGSATSKKAKA